MLSNSLSLNYTKQILLLLSVCATLLLARIIYCDSLRYVFLTWNLILAFVPFYISIHLKNSESLSFIKLLGLCFWLLFFPNSPYLVSDFIHLHKSKSTVLWDDVVLLFMFAYTGMYLAIVSATHIHFWLNKLVKKWIASSIMLVFFAVSSFGVYLGRVNRWNSWDLFTRPVHLISDIYSILYNDDVWQFSIIYFILISSIYFSCRLQTTETYDKG